jgi:hypothetical protein
MPDIHKTGHPVDIETGRPKDAQEVSISLSESFLQIETVASVAAVSEPSLYAGIHDLIVFADIAGKLQRLSHDDF